MKNKHFFLLFFITLALAGVQCKKERELDKLPPATTNGAQTLGCLINGDAFYTKNISQGNYYNGRIWIDADNQSPLGGKLIIISRGTVTKPGDYFLPYNDANINSFGLLSNGETYASRYTPNGFAHLKIT